MLTLNWNIIWTFVNILVLFFFLKKFLFKPVTNIMEQREEEIKKSFEEADKKNKEAIELKESYEKELADAKIKGQEIIKEYKNKAEKEYEERIDEAKLESSNIVLETTKFLEFEKEKSLKDAYSEIVDMAMTIASKVVGDNISEDTNKKLLKDILKEMDDKK